MHFCYYYLLIFVTTRQRTIDIYKKNYMHFCYYYLLIVATPCQRTIIWRKKIYEFLLLLFAYCCYSTSTNNNLQRYLPMHFCCIFVITSCLFLLLQVRGDCCRIEPPFSVLPEYLHFNGAWNSSVTQKHRKQMITYLGAHEKKRQQRLTIPFGKMKMMLIIEKTDV